VEYDVVAMAEEIALGVEGPERSGYCPFCGHPMRSYGTIPVEGRPRTLHICEADYRHIGLDRAPVEVQVLGETVLGHPALYINLT
jgi:hypothetical protein